MTRHLGLFVAGCLVALLPSAASAQGVGFRGFAEVGATTFNARQSFKAVLGSSSGVVYGGGVGAVFAEHIFVDFAASRFQKNGHRVFVSNGQVFDLGIPDKVSVTPFELSGGYRFAGSDARVIPYAGGGIGWHRYEETSDFAAAGENVKQTFTGYQVLGGVEFRASEWFGVSGEVKYASVPNALGQDPTGVSASYNETNLGGTTVVVKAILGK